MKSLLMQLEEQQVIAIPLHGINQSPYPIRFSSACHLMTKETTEKQADMDSAIGHLKNGELTDFCKKMPNQKQGLVDAYCEESSIRITAALCRQYGDIIKCIFKDEYVIFPDRYGFRKKNKPNGDLSVKKEVEDSLHLEGIPPNKESEVPSAGSVALIFLPSGQTRDVVTAKHGGKVASGKWERVKPEDVCTITHHTFTTEPDGPPLLILLNQWQTHGISPKGVCFSPYIGIISKQQHDIIKHKWETEKHNGANSKHIHKDLVPDKFTWDQVRQICTLFQMPFPYWGSGKQNTQHCVPMSAIGYPWVKQRYAEFDEDIKSIPKVEWPSDGTVAHDDEEYRRALEKTGLDIPPCVFEISTGKKWRLCPIKFHESIGAENMERMGFSYKKSASE